MPPRFINKNQINTTDIGIFKVFTGCLAKCAIGPCTPVCRLKESEEKVVQAKNCMVAGDATAMDNVRCYMMFFILILAFRMFYLEPCLVASIRCIPILGLARSGKFHPPVYALHYRRIQYECSKMIQVMTTFYHFTLYCRFISIVITYTDLDYVSLLQSQGSW